MKCIHLHAKIRIESANKRTHKSCRKITIEQKEIVAIMLYIKNKRPRKKEQVVIVALLLHQATKIRISCD